MTCIARPSASSMGYWATNMSVERRVCAVDERRRMSGASKTTEATWNDKKSSIIMLAGGDAHLVPQGQAASPPRPQGSKAPKAPKATKAPSPQACKPQVPIPKRPSPRVPKVAKPPSSQAPKPLSACPPSAQFSNFQIIRSASARPPIHRKRPSSKFRSPKPQTPQRPEPRSMPKPHSLRTSHFQHSPKPRRPRQSPPPKTPQAAGPCSWACRRLPARSPHSERNEAPKPPARGAWVREYGAEGTGWRHCRLRRRANRWRRGRCR